MDGLDGHISRSDAECAAAANGADGLALSGAFVGRKSLPPAIDVVRELTAADVEEREAFGAEATPGGALIKLRDTHHKAAKLFADGMSIAYISLKTGYRTGTLYTLKADPAFKQLIKFYKEQKLDAYVDTHERMAALAHESIGELRDRLDENPADIKTGELMEMAKLGLDRSGFGPSSTTHTLSASISAEDLIKMKESADQNEKGVRLIEARAEKSAATAGRSSTATLCLRAAARSAKSRSSDRSNSCGSNSDCLSAASSPPRTSSK